VRPASARRRSSSLEATEAAAIDALDTGVRGGPDPESLNMETYPKVVDNS
jgi:hypothetical protein